MVPTQIHLSHILFFMFLTWGNFLGFIFVPSRVLAYIAHIIYQEPNDSLSFMRFVSHKIQFDFHMLISY